MKLILYPYTFWGKLLVKLGIKPVTYIKIEFSNTGIVVDSNDKELLLNTILEFEKGLTFDNSCAKSVKISYTK